VNVVCGVLGDGGFQLCEACGGMWVVGVGAGGEVEEYGMVEYVWHGMVDVYDGYLAAEASGSSFG